MRPGRLRINHGNPLLIGQGCGGCLYLYVKQPTPIKSIFKLDKSGKQRGDEQRQSSRAGYKGFILAG